jgi:DNA-binding CsgD family transcriptional regulator/PAS domain-containing protein
MDLSEQSHLRFIDLIYEAAEKPDRWRHLYEELQVALGVKSIHMLALDKRHGTLSYSDGANMPVQGELAYMQHYRFIDPRLPIILQQPIGEWMHCHDHIGEDVVATHPFYQEFLLPYDRRYVSGTKLVDDNDATVLFVTLTGRSQGPLSEPARAFLDRLLPHLRRACRIGIRNFVYSTQALVGHLLVDKLRQPVILMTPGGEVMHANEAAQELLRSTRLVQVDGGRLRLPRKQLDELLRICAQLEQDVKAGQAEPQAQAHARAALASQFRSLRISDEGGSEPVYAFYTVLSPQGAMGTFGLRPVVMLLFYHPASAPAIDSSLLFAVFGLTPAECRIATLLAEGLSLKQIAQVQGTQHDTVRKQLRSIYQKTATNRQPELIRLLLHLPHNAIQR